MNGKDLLYFLGKILSFESHPQNKPELIETFENESFDWLQFVKVCSDNYILATVYSILKQNNLLFTLPTEVEEHFQEFYDLNYKRNERILDQARCISKLFSDNGITHVFLKGTANLFDVLYNNLGDRMIGDIDVLVEEGSLLKCADLLHKRGYKHTYAIYERIVDLKDYPRLFKPDEEVDIEVHQYPVDKAYRKLLSREKMMNEKMTIPISKLAYIPSLKHRLIHTYIHEQLANNGEYFGICSLRSMYDTHLLRKKYPVNNLLKSKKNLKKSIAYFYMVDTIIHNPLDYTTTPFAKRFLQRINRHYLNPKKYGKTYKLRHLWWRFKNSYICNFFKLFYSRHIYSTLYKKFTAKGWLKGHIYYIFTGNSKGH